MDFFALINPEWRIVRAIRSVFGISQGCDNLNLPDLQLSCYGESSWRVFNLKKPTFRASELIPIQHVFCGSLFCDNISEIKLCKIIGL